MTDREHLLTLPHGATLEGVVAGLEGRFRVESAEERELGSCFLDTFDVRLRERGLVLVWRGGELRLTTSEGELLGRAPCSRAPAFATDLPAGPLRETLEPVVDVRRLLPQVALDVRSRELRVLDERDKTVVRVTLESAARQGAGAGASANGALPPLVRVRGVRGYDDALDDVLRVLADERRLRPLETDELRHVCAALGEELREAAPKASVHLHPLQPAHDAARSLHRALLGVLALNEAGTRDALDTEFLHDYRVALRRVRSLLAQLPGVFPPAAVERFRAEFKWLGSVTGPARDADVLQLELPRYAQLLPDEARRDLAPLEALVESDRRRAYAELVAAMDSQRYRDLYDAWRTFLGSPAPVGANASAPNGLRPIRAVASERIASAARKVLKRGRRIDERTPAEPLHDLRIQCKKLRYLLDLFSSLYDEEDLAALVKALKRLQDCLGALNDAAVQQDTLREAAERLAAAGEAPPATLLAIGRVAAHVEQRRRAERESFAERFARFDTKKTRNRLDRLLPGGYRERRPS